MTLAPLFSDVRPSERLARLRSLRMASRLLCGPRGRALERPALMPAALAQIDALEALDRRRMLAAWGRTLREPEPDGAP